MLGRVAAVLFCLELVYLIVGNAVVRSHVIQRSVEAAQGFHLDFSSAYTLLPGRVHVRDLSLRVEDYNVQFEVAIEEASLDIAISELPFKKFHITRLDAQGTSFRMRHKLVAVGEDAERVAAYPRIRGFADPPYFVGVRAPSIPDSEYDLWSVRIENVNTTVRELWILEYRYRGPARAQGSFVVRPARWVQVEPAALWFEGGSLTLGEHLVAARMQGKMTCDIPDMHVQDSDGLDVLKDISATLRVNLGGGRFDFLKAYLARLGSARYGGNAEFAIDLNVTRGVIQAGSHFDVRGKPFKLHHEFADLSGDLMVGARRDAEPRLELAFSAPRLVASRKSRAPSPYLEGVAGSLSLKGADLTQELELGPAQLAVQRAHAESLAWFAPDDMELAGSADAGFEVSRSAASELSGGARLRVAQGRLDHGDFGLAGDLKSQLTFSRGARENADVELQKLDVQLSGASLRSAAKRSKPFDARVEGAQLRWKPEDGANAAGALRVHISSAEALLPLVMGSPLKDITSTALNLKQLDAQTAVQLSGAGVNVKVIDARSGNLKMRGYFSKHSSEPRGAFLLSSGPINVGVTLSGGTTEVSPFVGDGWLASAWPRISGAAPGSG